MAANKANIWQKCFIVISVFILQLKFGTSDQDTTMVWTGGELCICPFIYSPQCGADGNTYSNSCQADCDDVVRTENIYM